MQDHTLEQVAEMDGFFRRQNYPCVEQSVGGRQLKYYILPQDLNPDLPDFVVRATNDATRTGVFGVSESVPDELKAYFVLEDYIEFLELGIQTAGRVVQAEQVVFSYVPEEIKKEYLERRHALFKKELELAKTQPDKYKLNDEDRREFEANVRYLESELTKLKA